MHARVVIADDHFPVLASVAACVMATGATVVARARSPDEVFAALRDSPCDLLICDFAMPVDAQVDGIEMVHRIRTQWPELPVIMLTTMSNGVLLRALLAQGVRGLVDKVAPAVDLHAAMDAVERGEVVVSPSFAEAMIECTVQVDDLVLRREILRMLERGRSPDEVAAMLHVAPACVQQHAHARSGHGADHDPERRVDSSGPHS